MLKDLKHLATSVASLTALVILGGLLVLACEKKASTAADAPMFELPAWQGLTLEYGDRLALRRESDGGGALLLRHSRQDVVYKYAPDKQTLTAVAGEEWQRALGAVAQCNEQLPKADLLITQEHKLVSGGKEIPAAGQTVLSIAESPSGRWMAVLSASGKAGTSVIPFAAGGGASGRYYHQPLSLSDMSWIGKPVDVPTKNDNLIPCWSADEQFVVYHQTNFNYLSVVKTDLPSTSNPSKVSK